MSKKLWTAAAVALAVSGAALAADMSPGGSSNPASEKGVKTPSQPNESQPGMSAGTGDRKGEAKGMKGEKGMKGDKGGMKDGMKSGTGMKSGKGEMKGDAMGGSSGMSGMSSGSSNPGNPAEKGVRTPSQPNETQPGMGGNKK